jgi:hypothetical protein
LIFLIFAGAVQANLSIQFSRWHLDTSSIAIGNPDSLIATRPNSHFFKVAQKQKRRTERCSGIQWIASIPLGYCAIANSDHSCMCAVRFIFHRMNFSPNHFSPNAFLNSFIHTMFQLQCKLLETDLQLLKSESTKQRFYSLKTNSVRKYSVENAFGEKCIR